MTEARGNYPPYNAPEAGAFQHARIDSTIRYTPNREVLAAIGSILNDDGQAAIAMRGLHLSTRVMHFGTMSETQRFKAMHVAPLTERTSSPLARISLTSHTDWERIRTPRGDAFRVFMLPEVPEALALSSLYKVYTTERRQQAEMQSGDPYSWRAVREESTTDDPRERRLNRSLWFNVPPQYSNISTMAKGEERLNAGLSERKAGGALLYADYERVFDNPVTS